MAYAQVICKKKTGCPLLQAARVNVVFPDPVLYGQMSGRQMR
jgi:hypothetical protein